MPIERGRCMPPKRDRVGKENVVEPPSADDYDDEDSGSKAWGGRPPVWVYGADAGFYPLKQLPPDFTPSGDMRADYNKVCRILQIPPHPALKRPPFRRRPSEGDERVEDPCLAIRTRLMDTFTLHAVSLLLPTALHVKILTFSGCKLDIQAVHLLRAGLVRDCSVESLQIDWNPFDLPLSSLEDMPDLGMPGTVRTLASSRSRASKTSEEIGAAMAAAQPFTGADGELESRERQRYYVQSRRSLRGFRDWLASLPRGFDAALEALRAPGDADVLYAFEDFAGHIETRLGINGPQLKEVFDVLDGPDFAAGEGKVCFQALEHAISYCSPPEEQDGENDPIGTALAGFMDGDCVLESISLRSCALGRLELKPLSAALSARPWNLRVLNLWDNRICDMGAESLAAAMEEYRGLEFLGLGRNRITDAGFVSLCGAFGSLVMNEEEAQPIRDKFREKEEAKAAEAKAKAKGKAKAAPAPPPDPGQFTGKRKLILGEEKLEERPSEVDGEPSMWVLHRPCELRLLMFSENPITTSEAVEAVQPNGPKGAELVLRGTSAASSLLAKRPEFGGKDRRGPGPPQTFTGRDNHVTFTEGWVLRLV